MKHLKYLIVLIGLLSCLTARSASVTLAYTPSTNAGVAGTKIYWGYGINPATSNSVAVVTNSSPSPPSVTVSNVGIGVIHFQATSFLTNGLESVPSNDVGFTNRFFGPVNLQMVSSTNDTAALWINNTPTNAVVQWSKDNVTWIDYVSIKSLDPLAPTTKSIFVAGVKPDSAAFFRVVTPGSSGLPSGASLRGAIPVPASTTTQ